MTQLTNAVNSAHTLATGSTCCATVDRCGHNAAFLHYGDYQLFMPRSALTKRYLYHVGEVLKTGDKVEVMITGYNPETQQYLCSKLAVLYKQFEAEHKGAVVHGRVTSITKCGYLVYLAEDVIGGLHKDNIEQTNGLPTRFNPQDEIEVVIRSTNAIDHHVDLAYRKCDQVNTTCSRTVAEPDVPTVGVNTDSIAEVPSTKTDNLECTPPGIQPAADNNAIYINALPPNIEVPKDFKGCKVVDGCNLLRDKNGAGVGTLHAAIMAIIKAGYIPLVFFDPTVWYKDDYAVTYIQELLNRKIAVVCPPGDAVADEYYLCFANKYHLDCVTSDTFKHNPEYFAKYPWLHGDRVTLERHVHSFVAAFGQLVIPDLGICETIPPAA